MAADEYIPGSIQFDKNLPVNHAFLEEIEEVIVPTQADQNSGQIDFFIPPKDLFTANKFLLSSVCGVVKVDAASGAESSIKDSDDIAMVSIPNLLAYKAMTLAINGESVERYNDNAAYKSYFKFIGGHTKELIENHQQTTLAFFDDPEEMVGSNRGVMTDAWKTRKAKNVGRSGVALQNYLPFDICSCPKLFPPQTDIRITLFHDNDARRCQTKEQVNAPYRFKVQNPRLMIQRYILNKDKVEEFRKSFTIERPIPYEFQAMEVYGPFPIPKEAAIFTQRIRYGKRPNTVHLFFVESVADVGYFPTNAYYLQHMGITESRAFFGSRGVPDQGLKTQFTAVADQGILDVCDAYRRFFKSLGLEGTGQSAMVDYRFFTKGYTFMTFNFSPHVYSSKYMQPKIDSFADLSVELKFPGRLNVMHMYAIVVEDRLLNIRPNSTAELQL